MSSDRGVRKKSSEGEYCNQRRKVGGVPDVSNNGSSRVGFIGASAPLVLKCATGFVLMTLLGAGALHSAFAGQDIELRTISSRPDTISGGDVLVQTNAPEGSRWIVQLNQRDVTASFKPAENSGDMLALVTGLGPGRNTLAISVNGKTASTIQMIDHPRVGPMFSGSHQVPFLCETVANGLGAALDSHCNANAVVEYYYKSKESVEDLPQVENAAAVGELSPGFKVYDLNGSPPFDVAQTVTSEGHAVNYIVRREIGTINRGVYDIQFLHQPGQPLPSPWIRSDAGWNGRLVYTFGGGGCGAYRQGILTAGVGWTQEPLLSKGYALATSTLNISANNCSDRLSAETLSMVKEHFIEQYGEPVHTIGVGGSGGSMQLHLIAQNYPGLLDGIISAMSWPDVVSPSTDCPLLESAFRTSKHRWTEEQKTVVSGYATWRICAGKASLLASLLLDVRNCSPQNQNYVSKEIIYDRIANPEGLRCSMYDKGINLFGRNSQTGFAHRPLDNVGVQYGLAAFNEGKIDAEQFTELNERVGGYDEDGSIVAVRTQADFEALRIAYERGLLTTGGGGLGQIPIIDWRLYTDDLNDIHSLFQSFVIRARLSAANGGSDNQVILVGPRPEFLWCGNKAPLSLPDKNEGDPLSLMDRWLDNIVADGAPGATLEKISRNKPTHLTDSCWAIDGERIVEPATYNKPGRCNRMYPAHGDPRLVAGAPLTNDVLKCALKPIRPAAYSQSLTEKQLERLRVVFPTGVCDYSRPGIGQQTTRTVWQRFNSESQLVDQAQSP